MRLCSDTWIQDAGAPMGGQARRPRLPRGQFRGFQNVSIWNGSSHKANLVIAHPQGLLVDEPGYLISNAAPTLDLVWSYGERFCCEQLFRDQKSGLVQLECSGLRNPERFDRPLLVVAVAVLASSLQGYALSIRGSAVSAGSPLATWQELCTHRPDLSAAVCSQCHGDHPRAGC
jgi:hypothetical protein